MTMVKKPRWGWVGLFIGIGAMHLLLIEMDGIRWYRVMFVIVAFVGIYMELFVEDPRRTS